MANPHWTHADHLLTITGAPDPLITLAEAKAHLEVSDTDRDTMITSLVAAASAMIDGYDAMTGKAINEQTAAFSIPTAPTGHVHLPIFPVKSLTSVAYYDTDNVSQTINVANFRLVANEDYAWIENIPSFSWPAVYDRHDAITFTLLCGFAETPEPLKHAAKLMVGHWFENREAASEKSVKAIDWAVEALVGRYRKGWIGA